MMSLVSDDPLSELDDAAKDLLLAFVNHLRWHSRQNSELDSEDITSFQVDGDALLKQVDYLLKVFSRYEKIARWVGEVFVICEDGTMQVDLERLRKHPMRVEDLGRFLPGNARLADALVTAYNLGGYDPKDPVLQAEAKKLRKEVMARPNRARTEKATKILKRVKQLLDMGRTPQQIRADLAAEGVERSPTRVYDMIKECKHSER